MPTKIRTPGLRRGAPKGATNGMPPFEPTPKQREMVALWSAYGTPQQKMADKLHISLDTLVRHFRAEIDHGIETANAELGGVLYNEAKKGNVRALEQWFDRRGGAQWKRRVNQEHTGADGGPIQYQELSDEEIDAKLNALRTGTIGDEQATTH